MLGFIAYIFINMYMVRLSPKKQPVWWWGGGGGGASLLSGSLQCHIEFSKAQFCHRIFPGSLPVPGAFTFTRNF